MNWPISFSSTIADCVLRDPPVVGEHLRVAAGIEPDIDLAEQARRQDRRDRVLRELVALVDAHRSRRPGTSCGSSVICSTRPTTTPAALTGARSLSPPMLSKLASR